MSNAFIDARQWTDSSNAPAAPFPDNQSMFQLLFERSADAILLLDPGRQVFVDCNPAAVEMMRAASKQQLLMLSPADLSPELQPDGRMSRDKTAEMIALALAMRSHRFEWRVRRFDGTEFPIEVIATPIQNGEQPLVATVCRDISERKAAEVALRESEARFQRHRDVLLELAQRDKADFHESLETICALATATLEVARVSYWSLAENDSAIVCEHLHLLATRAADAPSKGARLGAADAPAYFEALKARRPIVANHVLEHPATRELSETYLRPLGITSMLDAPVWVRGEVVGVLCHEHVGAPRTWSGEEIDFASAVAAMVSLSLEESRRAESESRLRESEARFSAAFKASPVFISISRMSDGRFVLVNEAFLKWSGYTRDAVLGRTSAELGLWADPAERDPFWEELRRTRSIRERECRIRNRDGTVFTMLLSADLIEVDGVPHMLSVGLDISQRKQAEAELLKTLAREKELGQLRNHFVSMVSHEFRTPLGIIQSSAEILGDYLDALAPAERRDHLHSIQKNTRRMAGLMEEALLIGSIEAGRTDFTPTLLDLPAFARRLVDEVHSATDRRCPIQLAVNGVPAEVQADERLLRHVFTNLITNAVKYSEPESPVEFALGGNETEIVSTIRDRGIGIPKADQEWLFNAFHRGRNVGGRPGTGLGLLIVKRCVDLHGGSIQIESHEGTGTCVTVRLPRLLTPSRPNPPTLRPQTCEPSA